MRGEALPALALLAAGCTMGSDYARPDVAEPAAFRDEGGGKAGAGSLGEVPWEGVLTDPVLQDLVRRALERNYDLAIAATRVLEARARLVEVGADQYPELDAIAVGAKHRADGSPADESAWTAGGQLSWELDFWGKFRRATEAARAELLATEAGRRAVSQSVVADVAAAYFTLRGLDSELEISRLALASREASRRIVSARSTGGVGTEVELRQAEVLVLTASQRIPELESRIARTENALSILLGENPGPVPRGKPLVEQALPAEVPAGLPSDLLDRRPDLLAAEQDLAAACANVGEAKAALLPSFSLTAAGGVGSLELGRADTQTGPVWQVTAGIFQPIFDAGRLRAGVRAAEARYEGAALRYQQSVRSAFREVSDALVGLRKGREFLEFQRSLSKTLADQSRLSRDRYKGGVTTYLEVLDTERQAFDADIALVEAERDVRLSFVDLYRALGGGWDAAPLLDRPGTAMPAPVAKP